MKKFIYLLFILAAIRTSAQNYPPSVGPAPQVDNIVMQSEVFGSANPNSRGLTFIAAGSITTAYLIKHFLSSCSGIQVGGPQIYFPGAIARVTPNRHYILDQIGIRLLRMDTLGNFTVIGSITGLPQANLTGMTWDATTGTMYVVTTSLTVSQIGILDTATRVITPIGTPTTVCGGAISISCSPAGKLFVIDIVSDNLYRVDKTTGIFTLKGPLGQNANFGQDAHFDFDGTLYWAAYTTGPQLRVLDTTNGSSTLICSYVAVQATAISTISVNITGITPGEVIPSEFFIEQNYPNPFNPVTKIKFGIPQAANVKLTIYDVLGREVRVLVNEFKQPNSYEVDFDGSNLPSGVYFYKLVTDDFTSTKKMLMVK